MNASPVSLSDNGTDGKELHIVAKHVEHQAEGDGENEKLLRSTTDYNNDEAVQFEADQFITHRFYVLRLKQKRIKDPIKGLAAAVALQEQMGFQFCFSTINMDNNDANRESGTVEDANQRILDILQNPTSTQSRIHSGHNTEELDSLLSEGFEAYRLGHHSLAATKYKMSWELLGDVTLELQDERINGDVVCYMLCLSLLETNQLNYLSEAVELLLALESRSSRLFPAVYYALSKAHHKHYRFSMALKAIEEGFALLDSGIELMKYRIPGSEITLEESTRDGLLILLAAMKDECSKWHPPDAVCCMGECLPSSRWYSPNRDIYFRDPAFNGMTVLTCNNIRNPCTMNFHQACWKLKKDQLAAVKKLSDKDVIGYECFTPNCEDGQGNRSLIASVVIYGDDGECKTRIKALANPVVWPKRRQLTKGAIPKQMVKSKRQPEKIRRSVNTVVPQSSCKETGSEECAERVWRLTKLTKLRQNNFGIKPDAEWRPDMEMYGNPQMMEICQFLGNPSFENDPPQIRAVKLFVFTYFYEFIKENGCVRRNEIAEKWEEDKFDFDNYSNVLQTETDICEFLLQSYKLVSVGDYITVAENLPELYAVQRGEICSCLRFLLIDPLRSRALTIQDEVFNSLISNYDEKQNKHWTIATSDGTQEVNRTGTIPEVFSETCQKGCGARIDQQKYTEMFLNDCQDVQDNGIYLNDGRCKENEVPAYNSTIQDSSTLVEPKLLDECTVPGKAASLPVRCNRNIEEIQKWSSFEGSCNKYREYHDCKIVGELSKDQGGSPISRQDDNVASSTIDYEAGKLLNICNRFWESESTDYQDEAYNTKSDYNIVRHMEPQSNASICEFNSIITEDCDDFKNLESGSIRANNTCKTSVDHQANLFEEQRDSCDLLTLKNTKNEETPLAFPSRDTLTTEHHTQPLEQEPTRKIISQKSISDYQLELLHVEACLAKAESEKLEVMHKFEECQSERHRINEENIALHLKNTEWKCKFDKLCEEKAEIENNFDVLLGQKSALDNNLEMLERERENTNLTLQKYRARLKEKSYIISELTASASKKQIQSEHETFDTSKSTDGRRSKLQELNQKFVVNGLVLEKAIERCQDHMRILTDVAYLIRMITGRHFVVNEVQMKWQRTYHYLCHANTEQKEEYLKLKALLESNEHIANLEDVKLPCPNVIFPQVSTLAELYYKGQIRFALQPMTGPPNPWSIGGPRYQDPYNNPSLLGNFIPGRNINPRVGMFHNVSTGPDFTSNRSSQVPIEFRDLQVIPKKPQLECNFYSNDSIETSLSDGITKRNNRELQSELNAGLQLFPSVNNTKLNGDTRSLSNEVQLGNLEDCVAGNVCTANCRTEDVTMSLLKDDERITIDRQTMLPRKIGMDLLLQEFKRKFIGVPELDLLEGIRDVRKLHDDTLSGMRVEDILRESVTFVKQHQERHVVYYSQSTPVLPPERLLPPLNKPSQRMLTSTTPLEQKKKIGGTIQAPQTSKSVRCPPKIPTVPIDIKKSVWGLPTSKLIEWSKNDDDSECTICFESMKAYDKEHPVYVLPCQHSFHAVCIKKWLSQTSVCPICRIHCTMDDEFPPLPS